MPYSVRVQRIGDAGTPNGEIGTYKVETEMEAVMMAAARVEAPESRRQRIATVRDASGRLILAYSGCTGRQSDKVHRSDGA